MPVLEIDIEKLNLLMFVCVSSGPRKQLAWMPAVNAQDILVSSGICFSLSLSLYPFTLQQLTLKS